jgi:hypothetical protein
MNITITTRHAPEPEAPEESVALDQSIEVADDDMPRITITLASGDTIVLSEFIANAFVMNTRGAAGKPDVTPVLLAGASPLRILLAHVGHDPVSGRTVVE